LQSTVPATAAATETVTTVQTESHAPPSAVNVTNAAAVQTESSAVVQEETETAPPAETETQPATETETEETPTDPPEQILSESGFYFCYVLGDKIMLDVRFQETPDDPVSFNTAYTIRSDSITLREEKEVIISGNYCRMFVAEETETGESYRIFQYLRRDFSYTYPEESGWHFERLTVGGDCYYGFSDENDSIGDCIWDDGSYVMYVCAPRAQAEEIVKTFHAEKVHSKKEESS
jgi:hypothetical protein